MRSVSTYFNVFCCVSDVSSVTSEATYWGGNRCSVDRTTFSSVVANTLRRMLQRHNRVLRVEIRITTCPN